MSAIPALCPDVNSVLNVLVTNEQIVLGNKFIGMYLYGSLTYGDFDQKSHWDCIVVTHPALPESFF
jgi:hypothetical protein